MFDLFGKSNYKIPEPEPLWKSGPGSIGADTYRVGVTQDGKTTLTLMCNNGSTTLTMNQSACEQLIRLLESTLTEVKENENADS